MPKRSFLSFQPSLPAVLLVVFSCVLVLAGGASRADVGGQVVVRGAAWLFLIIMALAGAVPAGLSRLRPVVWVLGATVLLALLQLVPLPPAIWQALPGRAPLETSTRLIGQVADGQLLGWRPWSMVPGATLNAASSLIVPVAMLVFLAGLNERERQWMLPLMLAMVSASALLALVQVTGAVVNNPLINGDVGQVSGAFANRNHFALFTAFGCVLAPLWAFQNSRRPGWRLPVGVGLVLLFMLLILASGSRAGLGLGGLAIVAGVLLVRRPIQRELGHYPRWALPAFTAAIVLVPLVLVGISLAENRAVSIDRIFTVDQGEDMRSRALPTVLTITQIYFPAGTGLGGFDPIFRMHEPFGLLKLTYFNHAHNDFLEVAIDAGLAGVLLLIAALIWWGRASIAAWRAGRNPEGGLARAGSVLVALTLLASLFDYPARAPLIMAALVVAAVWLCDAPRAARPVSFTQD